jgi:hypothetical protein
MINKASLLGQGWCREEDVAAIATAIWMPLKRVPMTLAIFLIKNDI